MSFYVLSAGGQGPSGSLSAATSFCFVPAEKDYQKAAGKDQKSCKQVAFPCSHEHTSGKQVALPVRTFSASRRLKALFGRLVPSSANRISLPGRLWHSSGKQGTLFGGLVHKSVKRMALPGR